MTTMITLCYNAKTTLLETRDWITIFSVIAVITGWFVNGYLNRKNEIARKRLEYRLPTLKSFLKIWYILQESNDKNPNPLTVPENRKLFIEVREDFQLYGQEDEILLFEEFIKYGTGKNIDRDKAVNNLEKLVQLIRTRIRNELDI